MANRCRSNATHIKKMMDIEFEFVVVLTRSNEVLQLPLTVSDSGGRGDRRQARPETLPLMMSISSIPGIQVPTITLWVCLISVTETALGIVKVVPRWIVTQPCTSPPHCEEDSASFTSLFWWYSAIYCKVTEYIYSSIALGYDYPYSYFTTLLF